MTYVTIAGAPEGSWRIEYRTTLTATYDVIAAVYGDNKERATP